jgi:hypothetical protein
LITVSNLQTQLTQQNTMLLNANATIVSLQTQLQQQITSSMTSIQSLQNQLNQQSTSLSNANSSIAQIQVDVSGTFFLLFQVNFFSCFSEYFC